MNKSVKFSTKSSSDLTTETFQPASSKHISTPTGSSSQSFIPDKSPPLTPSIGPETQIKQTTPIISSSFTKIKSRQTVEHTTPTQNIVDDEDESSPISVSEDYQG